MEFVGELFRRKILPFNILNMIFMSLLGINLEVNKNGIDDLTIEAAVNLMNKVGPSFEEEVKKKKQEDGSKQIFDEFTKIMNSKEGSSTISNRIKILIKNLFSNKESDWEKTKQNNEKAPQTKAQVEKEVRKSYEKEQKLYDNTNHYQSRRDGYGTSDRRDRSGKRQSSKTRGQSGQRKEVNIYKPQEGGVYGKGAQEPREHINDKRHQKRYSPEESKKDIVYINDQALLEITLKNYQDFETKAKLAELAEPEE